VIRIGRPGRGRFDGTAGLLIGVGLALLALALLFAGFP
jgi:hypothetical protein